MSRALILMVQQRIAQRPLTAQEQRDCLSAWALVASGKRVYIPQPKPVQGELFNTAASLRENGWSIRKIARKLGLSKSDVHRKVSQHSRLSLGQDRD